MASRGNLRRLTEGFYDTRPQRSGRRRCHGDCTKCSRHEQKSRVCRCLHRRKMLSKQFDCHGTSEFPSESGPCVKTMLYDRTLGITEQGDQCRVMQTSECMLSRRSVGQHQNSSGIELKAASATEARTQRKCNTTEFVGHRASSRENRPRGRARNRTHPRIRKRLAIRFERTEMPRIDLRERPE